MVLTAISCGRLGEEPLILAAHTEGLLADNELL